MKTIRNVGFIGVSACLLSILSFVSQAEKDSISWHTYHRPPSSIKIGDLAGKGFLDKVTQQLILALPNYSHEQPISSPNRTSEAMRAGKKVCHPAYVKNAEREDYVYFSKPSVVAPSIRLVGLSLSENISRPHINLADLPKSKTFVFNRGRSHNVLVDDYLDKVPDENKMVLSTDKTTNLFQLIANKKVDFTFSYPIEVNYFNRLHPSTPLKTWHIEGVAPYVLGYVACAKNDWGKQVIEQINQVLQELAGTDAYLQAMSSWWPEELPRAEYKAFYESEFLSAHR